MSVPAPSEAAAAPPPAPKGRSRALIALVVAVVLVLVGVSAAFLLWPRAPPARDTVIYESSSEMTTLDPSTEFSNSILLLPNLYETLVLWDPASNTTKPLLATSWSSTPDGMNWTFSLRHGVTFHDGTAFNATAVKYSIMRTITMAGGAAYIWGPLGTTVQAQQNIVIIDQYTIKFVLTYPATLDKIASSGYAAYIFSTQTPGANATLQAAWFNSGHDSGTGPYTINANSDLKKHVVLDQYAGYWGGWKAGQFKHAIIEVNAFPAQRETAVTSGDVDVTIDVPVQDLASLQANSGVKVVENPSYRAMYAFFNSARGPTANLSFRQALAYAIPYDDIVTTVGSGLGTRSIGVIPAPMWGHDGTLPHYTFDLVKARALLNASGVSPLPTLKFTYTTGDLFEQKFGELYAQKLALLGITLNVQGMVWAQQWALAQQPLAQGSQDVFVMYWWPTYVTPYDFLFNMFSLASYAFFNLGYYNNSAFDTTINNAVALEATNPTQALADYRAAQVMLYRDVPGVAIMDMKNLYLMKADIKGFADNPAYPLVVFFYQLSL
jgi:peptide/nickel transport system substrate-binding protein